MTPNDPKLSDRGARRGTCAAGGEGGGQEAGAVTCGTVRCSAWLGVIGFAFDKGNEFVEVLQKLVVALFVYYVAASTCGNCSDQLPESLFRCAGEVTTNQVSHLDERWNHVHERASVPLVAVRLHVKMVEICSPSTQEGAELASPRLDGRFGGFLSLQSLGVQSPSKGEPSGSEPTSNSKSDNIRVHQLFLYGLLLLISWGFAWNVGYARHDA